MPNAPRTRSAWALAGKYPTPGVGVTPRAVEWTPFRGPVTAFAVRPRKVVCDVPRTRPAYPPEFRREAIELLRQGRTPGELSESLGVSPQTLRNWRPAPAPDRSGAGARKRPGLRPI